MFTFFALLTLAQAADPALIGDAVCPWQDQAIATVVTETNTVIVNGVRYDVKGLKAAQEFSRQLLACGEDEAADMFAVWRMQKRANLAAGPFGVLGTKTAKNARELFEKILLSPPEG